MVLFEGSEYSFARYRFDFGTANRRILSTCSSFGFGDFFSGTREEVVVSLGVQPFVGMVANLSTEWNRIDLPEGQFQTRLYPLTLDNQFNPWVFVVNNVQYDSVSDRLGWQIRFRWTIDPENDLYIIIYAELAGRHSGESFSDAGSTRSREIRLNLPVVSPRVAPLWWATVRTRGHTAHGEAT